MTVTPRHPLEDKDRDNDRDEKETEKARWMLVTAKHRKTGFWAFHVEVQLYQLRSVCWCFSKFYG